METATSWFTVGFVSTVPQQNSCFFFFFFFLFWFFSVAVVGKHMVQQLMPRLHWYTAWANTEMTICQGRGEYIWTHTWSEKWILCHHSCHTSLKFSFLYSVIDHVSVSWRLSGWEKWREWERWHLYTILFYMAPLLCGKFADSFIKYNCIFSKGKTRF